MLGEKHISVVAACMVRPMPAGNVARGWGEELEGEWGGGSAREVWGRGGEGRGGREGKQNGNSICMYLV